jgi:hypothetical protein
MRSVGLTQCTMNQHTATYTAPVEWFEIQTGQNCAELTDVNYATALVLKEHGPTQPTIQ